MCRPCAQLCFGDVHHREHSFTKICCLKNVQNFCRKGCHFGVAWKKILVECVQARQGKLGLQIWITLQVNYSISSCQSTGRSEGFIVNGEQKTWKSVLSWPKIWNRCLNSRNNSVILPLYWFKSLFSPVARTLFRQRKWAVSSPESCLPQEQLQLE